MPLHHRRAGLLLHPTSLPGRFGIGDLGPSAFKMLDWMHATGFAYWQILPLGPTGFGDSPYQCFSAFAGNPLLISPELLVWESLLTPEEINQYPEMTGAVDYGAVLGLKIELLRKAHERFQNAESVELSNLYHRWIADERVLQWLPDYALFRALKKENSERCWTDWPLAEKRRESDALSAAHDRLQQEVAFQQFIQFLFFHQWEAVRSHAAARGIEIIGDAPIYVSFDSADTWANQDEFDLNEHGMPRCVAGVPPDYFCETGQLWGNPLYNWPQMAKDGFSWWIKRMRAIFDTVDIVRLDHFRGFMGYYAVPAGHATAEYGEWRKGPGEDFFHVVKEQLGDLPIIAEDLGEITEDVTRTRLQFNLPGMVILQFAWAPAQLNPLVADPNNNFLPHRHEYNSVVYSGTHDNDTTVGWWRNSSTEAERTAMQIYLATDGNAPNWDLIRSGMGSVANTFIVPAQDILGLDSDCRMNSPGRAEGNWSWRLNEWDLSEELSYRLRELMLTYERCANPPDTALPDPPKVAPYL